MPRDEIRNGDTKRGTHDDAQHCCPRDVRKSPPLPYRGDMPRDKRRADRGDHRGTRGLDNAGKDEPVDSVRKTAEERSRRKDDRSQQEHPAIPPHVAKFAEEEEETREDEQVHDDRRGGGPNARVEIQRYLRKGDIDAADRKRTDEGAQRDEGEIEQPVPFMGTGPGPCFHLTEDHCAGYMSVSVFNPDIAGRDRSQFICTGR